MIPILRMPLLVALLAVVGCGTDSGTPTQPVAPPPVSGEPEVGTVTQVRVEVPGRIVVEVPGMALGSLRQAWLVNAAGGTGPGLPAALPPSVDGDTLAHLTFDIAEAVVNSLYNLRLQFGEAPGAIIRLAAGAVVVARPLPRIDSVRSGSPPGMRSPLTVRLFGVRLQGVDSLVIGSALAAVRFERSILEFDVADSLVTATFLVEPTVPTGTYSVTVWLHPTSEAAALQKVLANAVSIGSVVPPTLEPFQLATQYSEPRLHLIHGLGLSGSTFLRFEAEAPPLPPGAQLPTVSIAEWRVDSVPPRETISIWITVGLSVPPGSYRLIGREGASADTVPGALVVLPPADLPLGGTVTFSGMMSGEAPRCSYWFDWFDEFPEPCTGHTFTVTEPGQVIFTLEFLPEDCNPYGGLWFSISPPRATYIYSADCEPFSTEEYPSVLTEPGTYAISVGLHATPDGWSATQAAAYSLTATFTAPGAMTAARPLEPRRPDGIRVPRAPGR